MTMLLQILGFAALAAAMHSTPRSLRLRSNSLGWRAARWSGAALLILSMLVAIDHETLGLALIAWCGLATISAALVLLFLAIVRTNLRAR